ncbi:Multi-sensor Hybrid Histidine Kinase [Fulvivirga imtechensis AK7]|uniref:histidine kinase n=1 Tax=Fulvivirga imtechensis AK7 TaxID=1237149 RepID=L8JXF6_9BACT|nr:PAS domain-containing sensor histidine kinase [Fulvivirga imtechensis]ELR71907.1 Multi-sensor Hybrid Histidine Kinase [Fulvivirga imtechensis AK7]
MTVQKPTALEGEAGFRVLFNCATVSIIVVNERGCIELANPYTEESFGYSVEELTGEPVEILIPEELREKHSLIREEYFKDPEDRPMGLGMELYARRKNGEVFPVEVGLGHYELDNEKLAVAFITDISEQVQARKILADREQWLRSMADNAPVMIWVTDSNGKWTYFNKTWLQFTGRLLEDGLGTGWTENVHPNDLPRTVTNYNNALENHQSFSIEYRLRRHDGKYRWIRDTGNPAYTPEGEFTGYVGCCHDIHDQRLTQEKLEDLVWHRTKRLHKVLSREKEMNALKSRFVSMASHELRTPLSIALSSLMLVEQYGTWEKDERVGKHLQRIRTSINSISTILGDFLSLDKLEQGKVVLELEMFDLLKFMYEVIEDVKALKKKGQHIYLSHKGDRTVILDRKKLHYIMKNLVSNAIKYSPEYTDIELNFENNEKSISMMVRDHGIGIPEDEQQYMFNKFFRAKNTEGISGTGLGMTIVNQYVELMKGTIHFTSKEGEGTTFTMEMPQHNHENHTHH